MDIALDVLALATALKDIIKVVDDIQEAFQKLPKSYKNAQRLMADIRETLEAMNATYREDLETLDKDGRMKASFNTLKQEMESIYNACTTLIPNIKYRKIDKYKIAVVSFWNRDKMEELISDLSRQVDKSLRLFSILSSMRIEQKVIEINHGLDIALSNNTMSNAAPGIRDTSNVVVADAHLFSFTESMSTPMTWMPETIPFHELSRAFLRRELTILEKSLQTLSTRWFSNPPPDMNIPTLLTSWFLNRLPMSQSATHQEALMITYQIQDIGINEGDSWVHTADIKLSHLATYLGRVGMSEEALSIDNLRIDLWMAMATMYPGEKATSHLISSLTRMATDLSLSGNTTQSHILGERVRKIMESNPDVKELPEMQPLFAEGLATESRNVSDPSSALTLARSAVRRMEDYLKRRINLSSEVALPKVPADFLHFTSRLAEDASIHDQIFTYANLLVRLSDVQVANKLATEASHTSKRALVICQMLSEIYPGSFRLNHLTSIILSQLTQPLLCELNTADENQDYEQKNTTILADLTKTDPQAYVITYMLSLYNTHRLLVAAGKARQAQRYHQRMLTCETWVIDTYNGLKIPSETEGDYYVKLADYHFISARYQDAVYATQNAIEQFSALEEMSPDHKPEKHFRAAVALCKYLSILHQYDVCIAEGFKALHLLDRIYSANSHLSVIDQHMTLLDIMMFALDETMDSRALVWAREINSRIQRLFSLAKTHGHTFKLENAQAPSKYVAILQKNDQIEEASYFLGASIERWHDTYGDQMDNTMLGISYLQSLMALTNVFKVKGDTEQALKYSGKAMEVAEGFFNKGFHILKSLIYINLSSTHVYLLLDAGQYPEASQLGQLAVQYARENREASDSGNNMLIQALGTLTFCQLYTLRPQDAIVTAEEGIAVSKHALELPSGPGQSKANKLALLYISYLNLADGLADAGELDLALERLAEAEATLVKEEECEGVEIGSDVHSYQVIKTKRSRILFAKGEHVESVKIIAGVIATERERAKTRKSIISSLIRLLQFAGVAYCTIGRHDDGVLAVEEAAELKKGLADYTGLADLFKVDEARMMSRGLWKSVEQARRKLECRHQKIAENS